MKFVYVFDENLKEKLRRQGKKIVFEGQNEKGQYWCFEMEKTVLEQLSRHGSGYMISNRMTF